MECPSCQTSTTTERPETTVRSYRRFRCRACEQGFSRRTSSVSNRVQYPLDVACVVVLWRVRYKPSLRNLAEMCLVWGVVFSHEAVREWETKLAPLLSEPLRKLQRGKVGRSWYCDESVPRTHSQGTGQRCCTRDEGRSLGAGVQAQASNSLKLQMLRASVVSVEEKAGQRSCQVRSTETSVSEPLRTCRNSIADVETGGCFVNPGGVWGYLSTAHTASGMEAA